jgi:hypothetical protein
MKQYIYVLAIAAALQFTSCSENFLDRSPETSLSVKDFFKTAADLQAYTNGFYDDNNLFDKRPYTVWANQVLMADFDSDNTAYWRDHDYLIYLGTQSSQNISAKYSSRWGGWNSLRRVNIMLGNLGDAGNIIPADLRHFIGLARYFRAMFYIAKVKEYSDVPWYGKALESNDPDLYKPRDSRALAVDSIMADLEYAAANIKEDLGNRTRVNRFVALAELSRFALYEGTYRRYHSELNLASTAVRFLERAATAAGEIMQSQRFSLATGAVEEVIPGSGILGSTAFRELFNSLSLNANNEVIQWIDFNKSYNVRNRMGDLMLPSSHHAYSLSRSLMESFLMRDGRPFTTVTNHSRMTFYEIFDNRDPRMAETFACPGAHSINPVRYIQMTPSSGGYDMIKYFPESFEKQTSDNNGGWTGIPLYRYAEVLLNYAEARAELGTLTATDINNTIDLLRARVGMPAFNAAREVDADLRAQYPQVTSDALLAIRRERRVELAGEGLRKWDLFRWGAGKLHIDQKALQGIYIPAIPYIYNSDSNGSMSGLVATAADLTALHDSIRAKASNWDSLEGLDLYLDDGSGTPDPTRTRTAGHIRKTGDDARRFVEPKYYYRPIPTGQIVLNPNLTQPFDWD